MNLISREDFNLQGKLNTSRHKKGGTNGKTLGNTFLRKQRENEFKQSSPREGKPREESVMWGREKENCKEEAKSVGCFEETKAFEFAK